MAVAPGRWSAALQLTDATAGATSEISLTLGLIGDAAASVGVAVLSPESPARLDGSAVVWLNVSAATMPGGSREATLSLVNHNAPPSGNNRAMALHAFTIAAHERDRVHLQIFVDRIIIEAFAMGGRAEVVGEEYPPENDTTIHLFAGSGSTSMTLSNVSVYGMSCGWVD